MSKYSSKPTKVDRPSAEISDKFSDLTKLQQLVNNLPEDERAKIGDVTFNTDSIEINTQQVGSVRFEVVERTPELVKFKAAGSPVPVELNVNLKPVAETQTDVSVDFDVDIPMMLRPMVGPHLQKAVDMLGGVISNVASK